MFLRAASLIGSLMVPASAMAQVPLSFDAAVADLEVRYVDFLDAHLMLFCPIDAAALDAFYPKSYVAKAFFPEIVERVHEITEEAPFLWRLSRVFNQDLSETFDSSSMNTTSIVVLKATHVLKTLEFMAEFSADADVDTRMIASDLQKLRAEVVVSKELADCLRVNEMHGRSAMTEIIRNRVNESLDNGEYCIQWDIFVQRYLDIPFESMTIAERLEAGDRAFSDHDDYPIQSGISAECKEDT